jgi:peptide alpha-N-acetyltransferase
MTEPIVESSDSGSGRVADNAPFSHDDDLIVFVDYVDETLIDDVMKLVALDLSEPYSIFTYRYFLHRFPDLCILAVDGKTKEVCGCVVGKIDIETIHHQHDNSMIMDGNNTQVSQQQQQNQEQTNTVGNENSLIDSNNNNSAQTGYIGMLAVRDTYRRKGIGKALVRQVLQRMKNRGCTSVTLETEVSNVTAQILYQNFGFIREELLVRYYLNNGDAYRLRLWF